MLRIYLVVFSSIFILSFSSNSIAQEGFEPNYKRFTTNEGLNSNTVYSVIKSQSGEVWFSTDRGISKFDGHRFTNYTEKDGVIPGSILGLKEDSVGNIWYHTFSREVAYYSYQSDSFYIPSFNEILRNLSNDIYVDISFTTTSIFLSSKYNEIIEIREPMRLGDVIFEQGMTGCLNIDFESKARALNLKKGVKSDRLFDTIALSNTKEDSILVVPRLNCNVSSGHFLSDNEYLVVLDQGLGHIDSSWNFEVINSNSFYTLAMQEMEESNELWLGTRNGIEVREREDFILKTRLLEGYQISDIYKDIDGLIWITTLSNGVWRIDDLNIFSMSNPFKMDFSLSNTELKKNRLVYKSDGNQSLTTFLLDQDNPEFQSFKFPDEISSFTLSESGIYARHRLSTTVEFVSTITRSRPIIASEIQEVSVLNDYGIGVSYNASERLTKWFELFNGSKKHLLDLEFNVRPRFIYLTKDSSLYIQDRHKKFYYKSDLAAKEIVEINSLDFSRIDFQKITPFRDSENLILGNGDLLLNYKGENEVGRWDNVLHNQYINDVVTSNDTILFVSSEGVYFAPDFKENPKIIFNKSLGLTNGAFKAQLFNGGLFLITSAKIFKINNWRDLVNNDLPVPRIENLTVSNNGLNILENIIELPYNFGVVNFEVHYNEFTRLLNPLIRYRLSPLDNWTQIESTTINISNLSDKDYQLEIQAANALGEWGPSYVTNFIVLPPFYRSWWFLMIVTCLTLLAVTLYVRTRMAYIKRVVDLEDQMIRAQNQALAAQLNPHFVFNAMNSLVTYILDGNTKTSVHYLSKLASLMRRVFETSQYPFVSIGDEMKSLESYLQLEQLRFEFDYKIEQVDDELLNLNIPPSIVQPLIENAVQHGIDQKKDGFIQLRVTSDALSVFIDVENSGEAIDPEIVEQAKSGNRKSSLQLIFQRLEMIRAVRRETLQLDVYPISEGRLKTRARITIPKTFGK